MLQKGYTPLGTKSTSPVGLCVTLVYTGTSEDSLVPNVGTMVGTSGALVERETNLALFSGYNHRDRRTSPGLGSGGKRSN